MSKFNPDIQQTNDPDYRRYSKPIERPESDRSAIYAGEAQKYQGEESEYQGKAVGYDYQATAANIQGEGKMLSDAGEIFGTAVKAGDKYVKQNIDDTVYDRASATRDYYTAQLENSPLANLTPLGQVPNLSNTPPRSSTGGIGSDAAATGDTSGPTGTPMSLLPPDAPTPPAVSDAQDSASTLLAARMNGKLSETDYWMRQNALAKDLRNQYPGYKEYIDQQFEKVTGVNPANAVVKSLISDINANAQNQMSIRTHVLNELSGTNFQGVPNADVMWRAVSQGRLDPADAVSWMNKQKYFEYSVKMIKTQNEGQEAGLSIDQRKATADMNHIGPNVIDNYFSSVLAESGLGTTKNLGEFVQDALTGKRDITGEQALQLQQALQARSSAVRSGMYNMAVQAGWVDKLGAEKVNKMIDDQMVTFKEITNNIGNKDWGLMYANTNRVKALTEDTTAALADDKDAGKYNRILMAVNKNMGNQVASGIMGKLASKGYDTALFTMLSSETNKVFANNPDLRQSGIPGGNNNQPYTIGQAVDRLQNGGVTDPKGYAEVANLPTMITDNKIPDAGKISLVRAAFDPSNRDFIGKIQQSGIDSKGRPLRGQDELFSSWTSPQVTKEIQRLDAQDPSKGLWKDYQSWAEVTFGRTLFSKQIRDLSGIQDRERMQIRYTPAKGDQPPGFSLAPVSFDTSTPEGAAANRFQQRNLAGQTAGYNQAQDTLTRLNSGLRSMAAIAKTSGQDPDAYVLNLMVSRGFDPTGGKRPVTDIVQMLGNAVKNSREVPASARPSKGEITDKALPYNEENVPSSGVLPQNSLAGSSGTSLSDWLRQPAGVVAQSKQNAPASLSVAPRGIQDNFEAAKKDMKLNPQEQALYQRHLINLYGTGGVDNANGSRSTLYQASFDVNGKTYNIPTVWEGKILEPREALKRAEAEGLEKFPSYKTGSEAEKRYQKMHDYMEKDTSAYFNRKRGNLSDDGPIMGIQTTDIPDGVDPRYMIRALRNR